MRSIDRRLSALERLRRHAEHPARIPDWLRLWLDPLTIEDLELLETDNAATLSPEACERYDALTWSYARFCEEDRP